MKELTKIFYYIKKENILQGIVVSLVIIFITIIIKFFIKKSIDKNNAINILEKNNIKRKVSTYINLCIFLLLIVLWFSKLQAFIVSLMAVAVALVIALKEIIMCITGGLLLRINHSFKLGDRIEIDGLKGFVIEKSLTATKILEIGPEVFSQQTTGNVLTIPNSIMLNKSLKNESYFKNYSIKTFRFKIPESCDFNQLESAIINLGNEICTPYLKDAKKYISKFCEKEGLAIPSIEPRTKLTMNDKNEFGYVLKIPVPNDRLAEIEQTLLRFHLEISHKFKNKP